MPKFYKKVSRGNRTRFVQRKRPMFGRMDKAAYKMAKTALSLINTERKFHDVSQSANVTAAGSIDMLNIISQGTTDSTRVGDSIKAYNFLLRLKLEENSSPVPACVRFILIKDHEPRATGIPAVSDVLEAVSVVSPLNKEHGTRYTILKDWMVSLSPNGKQITHKKIFRKLNFHMHYKGNAGASTDAESNSLLLLYISDQSTSANQPVLTYRSRLRYIDN